MNSLQSEYKKTISESQRERKKLHVNLKAETFAKDFFLKRLSLHDTSFLPELAPPETVDRHFKSLCLLCHPDKGGKEECFKVLVEAPKISHGSRGERSLQ